MKKLIARLSSKRKMIVGVLALILVLSGAVYLCRELKSIRRDLYAVRYDYYASGVSYDGEVAFEDKKVNVKMLSQQVSKLRVPNNNYMYKETSNEPEYVEKDVRVVEIELTNNTDSIYTYYDTLGYINSSGIVKRTITVHNDDQVNPLVDNYTSLQIAKGAKVKVSIYFLDEGTEIAELIDVDSDGMGYSQFNFIKE